MTNRTLGKTGLSVSPLGFGCAPSAFLKSDFDALATLVNGLLDAGVNLIDTATMYPGSEDFIGQHLAGRRSQYTLVSKVGSAKAVGTTGAAWSAELIESSIDRGLKLMKTDVIDVMLLHSCDLNMLQQGDAVAALLRARDAGKIRFAGYSGDNDAAGYACTLREMSVVETSINYVDQVNIEKVLPAARANNVGIIVKRPIANAAWSGLEGRQGIYVNYAKEYVKRHAAMNLTAEDLGVAEIDWPSLALRFTLSFPEVSTAIVGTTRPGNAMRNLEIASAPPLDAGTIERVRARFRTTPGSGEWTGQT